MDLKVRTACWFKILFVVWMSFFVCQMTRTYSRIFYFKSLQPHHGSLLQYGRLFRYTPYKGFYGNDSFSYTFSDKKNNVASGTVNISVLSAPPQFVSLPTLLQATEDVICPRFG